VKKIPTLTELRMFSETGEQSQIAMALTEHLAAEPTRALLRTRYILGTVKQYEPEDPRLFLEAAQPHKERSDREKKHYKHDNQRSFLEITQLYKKSSARLIGAFVMRALVDEEPKVIGFASVQPDLELRRYREIGLGYKRALPLPPRLARHTPLVGKHPAVGSFVEAWTVPGYASELQIAYKELADPEGIAKEYHSSPTSWAVEPVDSPHWVHSAIKAAGYVPIQKGHFEHDASRLESPPLSMFYQRVQLPPTA
jgi:hypothetical protein